jgi:hypothetical protein
MAMGSPGPRQNVCKVFKRKDLSPDFRVQVCELNAKARLLAGPPFSICFYFSEWSITKMPLSVELFLSGKLPRLFDFPTSMRAFE